MFEKWKRSIDTRGCAGALLTDTSKALSHDLLIAKLSAYCVGIIMINTQLPKSSKTKG